MSEEWLALVNRLKAEAQEAARAVSRLESLRRSCALPAKQGDKKAAERLAQSAIELAKAEEERADLGLAIGEAEAGLQAAQAEEAAAETERRREEAAVLVSRRIEEARTVDEALLTLSAAARAYLATGHELIPYFDVTGQNDYLLTVKFPIGSAFAHADRELFHALDGRPVGRGLLSEHEVTVWAPFLSRRGVTA
ncbi:MAG: hypothetical protein SGJ01_13155 [Gemmatimonadota bacterium]|nr:hypothetical protein [Gemmatimonadota bacterium]